MNSIKKNFLYNSICQIFSIIAPLVTTPYLSRILGVSGIGEYSYTFSVASYFVIFIMLGINNYGSREIAKCRDNAKKMSEIFWSIYAMQFSTGIVMCVAYIIYIIISDNKVIPIIWGIYVLSGCIDINWFCSGTEQFKFIAARNIAIKLISICSIFILVKTEKDVCMYCLIMASGQLACSLVIWPRLLKSIDFYKPSFKEIIVHIKPNLILFMTVIAVSLFKIMDKIMLGVITTKDQVGFYEVAEKIISIPMSIITSLGMVMLPRMSNLVEKEKKVSNRLIYMSAVFASFMVSSLCFGIMGVSKTFVPLFYGLGYDICIYLYLILLPSCIFLGLANVVRTQYLLPHSMDKVYVISAFLGAGTNVVINLYLIPKWGAIGAAVGTLLAEFVVCLYQCYKCRKGIDLTNIIRKSSIFIINGIIMFLVVFNMNLPITSLLIKLIVQIIFGALIYLFLFGVDEFIIKKTLKKPLLDIEINKIQI